MRLKKLVCISVALSSIACAFAVPLAQAEQVFHSNSSPAEEAAYDAAFPTYAEACAASQDMPLQGAQGGLPGHGVLYIRGLCRDETASFPRLRPCTNQDRDPGVAISVDQVFKNVNWVAIPGRDFVFRGDVADDQPLTSADEQAAIGKALAEGYFRNVTLHEQYFKGYPADETHEQWLARESLDTSFALNFHRDLVCARIPMTTARLAKMMDYLNKDNEQYYLGGKDYEWDLWGNSCAHIVHNALAAAGFGSPIKIDAPFPLSWVNFTSPISAWADAVKLSDRSYADAWKVYEDPELRDSVLKDGVLPSQAGGVVEVIPVHSFKNSVGDLNTEFHFMPMSEGESFELLFSRYFNDPHYTDLMTNLEDARESLEGDAIHPQSLDDIRELFEQVGRELPRDFPAFYGAYLKIVQAQYASIRAQIAQLSSK